MAIRHKGKTAQEIIDARERREFPHSLRNWDGSYLRGSLPTLLATTFAVGMTLGVVVGLFGQ